MPVRTIVAALLIITASNHSAMAQTLDAFENCVSPVLTTASNCEAVVQSQVVATRVIPLEARLLSSRIVATGVAPVTGLNSFSSFGTPSIPVGTQFVGNSLGIVPTGVVQAASPFGCAATVGVPASVTLPSTLTLNGHPTLVNSPFAVASPGVAKVLAGRITTENCRSTVARVQSSSQPCCSSETLQNFSNRVAALDARLAQLERSLGTPPAGGGSGDGIDDLLQGTVK